MIAAPRIACIALVVLLPAVAMAEDVTAQFRLVAAPNNVTGCIAADPQFTRVHAFTDYDLGRLDLHIVADLAATPPSLTVDDKNLGCKWTAEKE